MLARLAREHFLKEMGLHLWLGEWVGLDGHGGQGSSVHTCRDGPEGRKHVDLGLY